MSAAPARQRILAQTSLELRLLLRNGENLLVTLGIPIGLLVFFSLVPVLPTAGRTPVDFLLPGVLVIAVMGAALVSLAISTGFERSHLVLKRLGATPLRRRELLVAKLAAVLVVELAQVIGLFTAAAVLGWRPGEAGLAAAGAAAVGLLAGTAAFAGIGLALAGRLPALTTLALVNGVFVVLVLTSGLVFPLEVLPGALRTIAGALPAAALAAVLDASLAGGAPTPAPALVLALWALGAPVLATQLFRWE